MTEITCDDIRLEIRATKRRLMAAVQDGRVPDDFVAGAIEFYGELHHCITSAIEAGRENIECDWAHVADMVWARYDVEDMLDVLNALMELPRWD